MAIMLHSIWTVLLVFIFIGIVAWAYSGKRKLAFEEAARLPLEDDHDLIPSHGEKNNG
jgi:cytochrome c oxidase cbb3-type subunit 4